MSLVANSQTRSSLRDALGEQNGYRAGVIVGCGEVGYTVAVKVSHRGENRIAPRARTQGSKETSVSFSEEHGDRIAAGVCHGQIQVAISIEISNCYGLGICTGHGADWSRPESPIPPAD